MSRDIRVESKDYCYTGSKSSDLIITFDLFYAEVRNRLLPVQGKMTINKAELQRIINYMETELENRFVLKNYTAVYDKLTNMNMLLQPKDKVTITIT